MSLVFGTLLLTSRAAMAQVEFIGVNTKATLTDNKTVATVTGSIVCGSGDTFEISSVIQQNHAGTNVAGSFAVRPVGDGVEDGVRDGEAGGLALTSAVGEAVGEAVGVDRPAPREGSSTAPVPDGAGS